MNKKLWTQLLIASTECNDPLEEQGGLILNKDDEYTFVLIRNVHEGSQTAIGLYETDKQELKEKVFSRIPEGWKMYGSFHTHPCFSATPSVTDMTYLFQGFENNYVYSPKQKTFSATTWEGDTSTTTFMPINQIKELLQQ